MHIVVRQPNWHSFCNDLSWTWLYPICSYIIAHKNNGTIAFIVETSWTFSQRIKWKSYAEKTIESNREVAKIRLSVNLRNCAHSHMCAQLAQIKISSTCLDRATLFSATYLLHSSSYLSSSLHNASAVAVTQGGTLARSETFRALSHNTGLAFSLIIIIINDSTTICN